MLSVEVLGPVRVRRDGHEVPITSRSQRLLLAVLAAAYPGAVPLPRLIDALWDDPPASAENSMHSHLTRLRERLGPGAVERVGNSYQLTVAPDATSLADDSVAWLAGWRGPAYGELAEHRMVRPVAAQLDGRRAELQREHAAALLASGRVDVAIRLLRAHVAEDVHDEHAWALLVGALGTAGRRAEALRAAHEARTMLAEVGLEPSDALRAVEADQLESRTGPAAGHRRSRTEGRLPRFRSVFRGRHELVRRILELLAEHEWITLVGPGGVGKTRLAVEAVEDHPREARFCDLSAVAEPDDVEAAIARAVGVDAVPPVAVRAADVAVARGMVLVIDNCEHVWEAVAAFGAALAAAGDGARVLATSRRPLGVDGEVVVELAPLEADDAAALLCDRAADLGVQVDDPEAVRVVCDLADGLPLALEMAAGLLRTMSVDDLVTRVDRRLELLGSGQRRTLRATMDSSVDALTSQERTVFARLSLFVGPFSFAQAERVVASEGIPARNVASLVAGLRNQSLLQSTPTPTGQRMRLLPIVRDVAAEHLGAAREPTIRQHLALFADEAEAIDRGVCGPDEAAWLALVDIELGDLRAAVGHGLASGAIDDAGRVASALFNVVYAQVRPEVGIWSDDVLRAGPPADRPLCARLSATAALAAFQRGDVTEAAKAATAAIEVTGDDPSRRYAELVLGNIGIARGWLDAARRSGERAAADAEPLDDYYVATIGHVLAALALGYGGRVDDALARVDDARAAALVGGSATALSYVDYTEGEILADREPVRAEALLLRSLDSARAVGSTMAEGVAWVTLSSIRARHGDPVVAVAGFQEAIVYWRNRGDVPRLWVTLRNLAELLVRMGHDADAAVVLGAVDAVATPAYGAEAVRLADARRQLLSRLGPEAQHHFDKGCQMPRRDLLDHCLAL